MYWKIDSSMDELFLFMIKGIGIHYKYAGQPSLAVVHSMSKPNFIRAV